MHIDVKILHTLDSLKLLNKHICVIVDEENIGMLRTAKDFITYGEISPEVLKLLLEKRGNKGLDGKPKMFFRLAPPVGGFERKGIKLPFASGGALGDRGEKINDLIKKMI